MQRLLQREGGQLPLERVTLRGSDYVDIGEQEAADLIDQGTNTGVYTLERGTGGTTTITGVSPHGPEPEIAVEAFGPSQDTGDGADFTILSVVTESINEALQDAGYETFAALADAEVDDLVRLTGTLTQSRAAAILQEAPQHVPVGSRLAVTAGQRYARRIDTETNRGVARVVDLRLGFMSSVIRVVTVQFHSFTLGGVHRRIPVRVVLSQIVLAVRTPEPTSFPVAPLTAARTRLRVVVGVHRIRWNLAPSRLV